MSFVNRGVSLTSSWQENILRRIEAVAFFLFAILMFFLSISNAMVEIASSLILICLAAKGILTRPSIGQIKTFFQDKKRLAVLVFYLCLGLSVITSPLPGKSFNAWISKWGEGVMLFFAAQLLLKKEDLKKLLLSLLAGTFVVTLDGLYQRMAGVDFLRGMSALQQYGLTEIRATFNHYNGYATFLVSSFFLAIGIWMGSKRLWGKIVLGLLIGLILTNLLLTYSRGGWIAFLIACAFLIVFFGRVRVKIIFTSILVIFFSFAFAFPSIGERVLMSFKEGGDASRFRMWFAALLMFKDFPILGKGLGTFMDYLDIYLQPYFYGPRYPVLGAQYAHNCYLQILAETGLFGLLSFLWMFGKIMWEGFMTIRKKFEGILFGLTAGLLGYSLHAFFDSPLFSLRLAILFWIFLGFLAHLLEDS